jgi:hypothetical protein
VSEVEPGVDRLELAALMKRVFHARAEEKRTLLSSVRAGRPVGSIPPPEIPTDGIEALARSVVPSDTPPSFSSLDRLSPPGLSTAELDPPARRPRLTWAIAAVLVGALLAGGAALFFGPEESPVAASDDASSADVGPSKTGASGADGRAAAVVPARADDAVLPSPLDAEPTELERAPEALVRLSLRSTPAGARALDPRGDELCVTPCALELPRAQVPARLTFRRRGFVERTLDVRPTSSELTLEVVLTRTPRRAPSMGPQEPEFFRID